MRNAIATAQEALPSLGVSGTVVDIRRRGSGILIVLDDYSTVQVNGFLAAKLKKMMRTSYLRWRKSGP